MQVVEARRPVSSPDVWVNKEDNHNFFSNAVNIESKQLWSQ